MSAAADLPFEPRLNYYRGRVALHAILSALGVGRGDRVLIQAFTCVAVPEAVFACGAAPVFVDIESDGFNMDPARVEERIDARTRAIVVQHTFGIAANLTPILEIAQRHGLPVIEDCCHSYYSQVDARTIGTLGTAAFYSFEWGKPMILGLGGVAIARSPELQARLAQDHAQRYVVPPAAMQLRLEAQYWAFQLLYRPALFWMIRRAFRALSRLRIAEGSFHALGGEPSREFGWRMAPLLMRRFPRKLAGLAAQAEHARQLVRQYQAQLVAPGVVQPRLSGHDVLVRYPLRVQMKEELLQQAQAASVELANWYATPVHPIPPEHLGSVGLDAAECPQALLRCAEIVSLPVNTRVSAASVERAAALLRATAKS